MLSEEEIRNLTPEEMNKDIDKASAIHKESMELIKDICKEVLKHSSFITYLIFVAELEKFFTDMLNKASTVEPVVEDIRRIVRMSKSEVLAEISDKLKPKEK